MPSLQVSKLFQGPLILQALAAHIKDIDLIKHITYEFGDNTEPQGALILAVTAVGACQYHTNTIV